MIGEQIDDLGASPPERQLLHLFHARSDLLRRITEVSGEAPRLIVRVASLDHQVTSGSWPRGEQCRAALMATAHRAGETPSRVACTGELPYRPIRSTAMIGGPPKRKGVDPALIEQLLRDDNRRAEYGYQLADRFKYIPFNFGLSRADAADVLEEVVIQFFYKLRTFRGQASLETWFMRILVNRTINRVKRDRLKLPGDPDAFERLIREAAVEDGHASELLVIVALSMLDHVLKEVLILHVIQGHTILEIMDITGLSEGGVKDRLRRAKRALKERFLELLSAGGGPGDE